MDLSALDKKYFIDPYIYNCPFCKRNNVRYKIADTFNFDWTEKKKCYSYLVECQSEGCGNKSLHLSWSEVRESYVEYNQVHYHNRFVNRPDLDTHFFYSQPTSYFVLDNRIPDSVRELVYEAENCRKANYLVGASACLRKAIYELLEHEGTVVKNSSTGYANYEESIKALAVKFSKVEEELFNALGHIQEMTSDNVHEGSWDAWDSSKLKILIELTKATLHEMYVVPAERKERLNVLGEIKTVFSGSKNSKDSPEVKGA